MNQKFFEEMLSTCSVSGHEEELQRKVIAYMKDSCDEIMTDVTGNVISVLNPQSNVKVLLCGHIDEIGYIVTHIQNDGSLKVTSAGGLRHGQYIGTHVQIKNEKGIVHGVVVTNSSILKKNELSSDDITIDIGAKDAEDAKKYVSVGDPVCASTTYEYLLNGRMAARAMDNRVGAFIVLESLKRAKEKGCSIGIYSATTVGEETTMRGAYWASQKVKPICALAIDVTFASDYEGVDAIHSGDISLDKGPVLCHSSIVNKKMNQLLKECALELGINVQYEVASGRTGTDADHVHFTNDGVAVALVSIPLRYMHSSIETLSLKDVEDIIELVSEFLCKFNEKIQLNELM
ncbi:MAG: M42 family peptidase [Traorella sp.]